MFCGNCGTNNPDDAKVCGSCGAPLTPPAPGVEETPAAPSVTPPVNPAPIPGPAPAPAPKEAKKTGLIAILGIAAAAVLAVVLVISLIGKSNGPEARAKKFILAATKADAKTLVDMLPPAIVKEMMDNLDFDNKREMIDELKDSLDDAVEDLKDEYGSKYKVTVEVRDVDKLKSKELKNLKSNYEDDWDIKNVKDARDVTLKMTISGDGEKDKQTTKMRMVKIGGTWYVDYSSFYTSSWF